MHLIRTVSRRIRTIRALVLDLHDPRGVYFHRAGNACLATSIAAAGLYFFPEIARPLLVLASLCFTLTTNERDRPERPTTLLGSLIIVLSSTSLLILTWFQPLWQGAILIVLGFLVQYLTQFSRAFAGGFFVWILCLLAVAGNPLVEQLPGTLLNIALGWLIVYLCYFVIAPYRPRAVFLSLHERVGIRLATRLQQVIDRTNPATDSRDADDDPRDDDLDRRIASLLTAQNLALRQMTRSKRIPKSALARSRQTLATIEELFEALLVLETSLLILQSTESLPSKLESGLLESGRRAIEFLERMNSRQPLESPPRLEVNFERDLEEFAGDRSVPPATRIRRQNTRSALRNSFAKIHAVAELKLEPKSELAEENKRDIFSRSSEEESPQRARFFFDIHHPVHRRATRTAIAIFLAMVLVYLLNPSHGEWIILSAFIVSQDTVGSSLWKAEGRLWGALAGAIASVAIYALIRQHHALIFFTAFLTIFPYVYLLSALDNYGYAYFFLQVAYVCFLAAVGKPLSVDLIEWRAIDIVLGCLVGIGVALFVLPTSDRPRLQKGQLKAWNEIRVWFTEIVTAYRTKNIDRHHLEQLGREALRSVFLLEKHLASRKHEFIGKLKAGYTRSTLQRKDTEFIEAYQPIYRSILYFSYRVQNSDPVELSRQTREKIHRLNEIFERIDRAIGAHSLFQIPPLEDAKTNSNPSENSEENLTRDELNFTWQLSLIYESIASYSEIRNEFLSMLSGDSLADES